MYILIYKEEFKACYCRRATEGNHEIRSETQTFSIMNPLQRLMTRTLFDTRALTTFISSMITYTKVIKFFQLMQDFEHMLFFRYTKIADSFKLYLNLYCVRTNGNMSNILPQQNP